MADGKNRDWYGKDKKKSHKGGDKKDGDGEHKKAETVHERHARERGEAHDRHASARKAMTDSHEEELAQMAKRHAEEVAAGQGTETGTPAAESPVQGAASGTPPAVAGTPPAA